MKILKFGGTSVGTAESLHNVKNIVESGDRSIVVVSALGGITDLLIKASEQAAHGDTTYLDTFERIRRRHLELIDALFASQGLIKSAKEDVERLLAALKSLYDSVLTLQAIPEKTRSEIVSFGERMSSLIISKYISGSILFDSLSFIKTVRKGSKTLLDQETTESLVREAFSATDPGWKYAIVPGFISRDKSSGEITNLGRGGSDYTASIIAAAIEADCLEIWTDVDGFMTADPRIIKSSYVIEELSFAEAMELCNFGAKVIYAPALYPVYPKDIPVLIKNTFNPSAPGTLIRRSAERRHDRIVTGISSINEICLLTLSGSSMVGIVGVDGRLFKALSRKGISVFLVSQSSSETGISIGVGTASAEEAKEAINEEFGEEIERKVMNPVHISRDLSAIAVVGKDMKQAKGVAGKLFTTLGRNSIGVLACAQGSSEYNISIVVDKSQLKKALNVIHDSFFLSEYQELNLFVCGIGTVGSNLLRQIESQREKLMAEDNLKLNVVGIARSTKAIFDRDGIDLAHYHETLEKGTDITPKVLRDEIIGMNIFNSVFVDCTASAEIAGLYKDFFEHGVSVVAANKIAASSDYTNYAYLKGLSRAKGVKFLFETNVGAGLPIINTINALRNSGDRILKIEAVVSGTINYIFNTLSEEVPFSKAVRMAQEQGYSEPDPRMDLSGKDVVRKLVILAREAGYEVNTEDVEASIFIPEDFFECSIEEFWKKLPSLDEKFESERKRLVAANRRWRFVASMEDGRYRVSLREFELGHSFYVLEGSNNIILLTTERYNRHPMLIQGYGAGAEVTAAGVFADIMSIANV
ncbi:MAG: bifunctional aspartate kinase/homoserine dehydrogenase I [Bacteroidales bacterium]|nr:bifunctional aspartate kinase/homoserine dehydrogenase I [Bacteroidales bacterium]